MTGRHAGARRRRPPRDHRAADRRGRRLSAGYLLWGVLIPHYGIERGKVLAEWLVWIPFGGATIVAVWWLTRCSGWAW